MRAIARDGEHELVINRSRFLCAVARVSDEESARGFIAERRRLHWNATHNCVAYVVGSGGAAQRSSDDGEPAGTAGVPMLEVLRHRDLTDTVAVVTRYFGGVKLGAGGLVRAYGRAVSEAIDAVGTVALVPLRIVHVSLDYVDGPRVEPELRAGPYTVLAVDYGAEVRIDVAVAEASVDELTAWVASRAAGRARVEPGEVTVVEVPE
ncbi:YigZ family protein [Stackebrandtia soli]|uniref:YigZ family protein n=1 Tax=Stackebrandtia soli TaxID=1892856 RepID=UPI0039E858F9